MTRPDAPPHSPAQIPLWRQLQAAAEVLHAVRNGASATPALAAVDSPLRPGVQALVFHTLRNLGRAEALRVQLAKRPPPPPADALLCTALALVWDEAAAPYAVFTLVDQAVEAANRGPARAQASFINACLRRFLRERDALVSATDRDPVAVWNHPRWWIQRLKQEQPQRWQEILQANNQHAPMTLRVNAQKSTPAQSLSALAAINIEAFLVGDSGIALAQPRPVHDIPGFSEGAISVQDAAAQLAAPLLLQGLDRTQPLRILDACAAPGGKTAHLLELVQAELTALDIDATRCERIQQNLQRQGLQAKLVVADANQPDTWWDGQLFDAILLDAPCTASGIVRRHPDVRWLRRETDIAQLAVLQASLLQRLWPLLRPGGRLLYCTCSVFRAEGQDQIETFLAHHTEAHLHDSPGHLMPRTWASVAGVPDNRICDNDGFFYALLEKRVL
ncbi:16S rRNA (cytosine967-C5)-methyltransferase [Rhodoferax ferrireducens]|uniref:16S rRNA (cytosine(967)-C(5))-methyltransferase n=1 Tax=Rhodoferax ferrireducens TaxID=192843 RepID=A0ABU2CGJ0_9BURK|nr:16S rRNA (cytosine(967)-C(5))-methyltransferase RsmB [Rhodoferax ferrireducens]MDR7380459.1 16S rRNA (cytosine967-C5)-methyltransferase [Rhodoferax ferrireducens]